MSANRTRNRIINFRCTEGEYDLITSKIAASGRTKTEFLLDTLLDKEIVIYPGMREVLAELKREGINLNQALRFANHDQMRVPELNEAIKNCDKLFLKYLKLWQENCR
jgi:hypothetical protein